MQHTLQPNMPAGSWTVAAGLCPIPPPHHLRPPHLHILRVLARLRPPNRGATTPCRPCAHRTPLLLLAWHVLPKPVLVPRPPGWRRLLLPVVAPVICFGGMGGKTLLGAAAGRGAAVGAATTRGAPAAAPAVRRRRAPTTMPVPTVAPAATALRGVVVWGCAAAALVGAPPTPVTVRRPVPWLAVPAAAVPVSPFLVSPLLAPAASCLRLLPPPTPAPVLLCSPPPPPVTDSLPLSRPSPAPALVMPVPPRGLLTPAPPAAWAVGPAAAAPRPAPRPTPRPAPAPRPAATAPASAPTAAVTPAAAASAVAACPAAAAAAAPAAASPLVRRLPCPRRHCRDRRCPSCCRCLCSCCHCCCCLGLLQRHQEGGCLCRGVVQRLLSSKGLCLYHRWHS